MSKYAANTSVSSEKSRNEIERTLRRYGADQFAYATSRDQAMIGFAVNGRQVRFVLPMPDPQDKQFTLTPTGKWRSDSAAEAAYEQAIRQRWRALALVVKAKLEAVEAGIVTFDQEFLSHMVLPGGQTVFEATYPQIEQAYSTGQVPELIAIGS